jgi:hypothetical protein
MDQTKIIKQIINTKINNKINNIIDNENIKQFTEDLKKEDILLYICLVDDIDAKSIKTNINKCNIKKFFNPIVSKYYSNNIIDTYFHIACLYNRYDLINYILFGTNLFGLDIFSSDHDYNLYDLVRTNSRGQIALSYAFINFTNESFRVINLFTIKLITLNYTWDLIDMNDPEKGKIQHPIVCNNFNYQKNLLLPIVEELNKQKYPFNKPDINGKKIIDYSLSNYLYYLVYRRYFVVEIPKQTKQTKQIKNPPIYILINDTSCLKHVADIRVCEDLLNYYNEKKIEITSDDYYNLLISLCKNITPTYEYVGVINDFLQAYKFKFGDNINRVIHDLKCVKNKNILFYKSLIDVYKSKRITRCDINRYAPMLTNPSNTEYEITKLQELQEKLIITNLEEFKLLIFKDNVIYKKDIQYIDYIIIKSILTSTQGSDPKILRCIYEENETINYILNRNLILLFDTEYKNLNKLIITDKNKKCIGKSYGYYKEQSSYLNKSIINLILNGTSLKFKSVYDSSGFKFDYYERFSILMDRFIELKSINSDKNFYSFHGTPNKIHIDKLFITLTFLSTTINMSTAQQFAQKFSENFDNKSFMYIIYIPFSLQSKLIYIEEDENYEEKFDEYELLFPPGSVIEVKQNIDIDNITYFICELKEIKDLQTTKDVYLCMSNEYEDLDLDSIQSTEIVNKSDLTETGYIGTSETYEYKDKDKKDIIIKKFKRIYDYNQVFIRIINEMLAANIYKEVYGLETFDYTIYRHKTDYKFDYYIGSLIQVIEYPPNYSDYIDGFFVDCILSNWDVYNKGNIGIGIGTGTVIRTDVGGSLLCRALGEYKIDFKSREPKDHLIFLKQKTFLENLVDSIDAAKIKKMVDQIQLKIKGKSKSESESEKEKKLNTLLDEAKRPLLEIINKILPTNLRKKYIDFIEEIIEIVKFRHKYYINNIKDILLEMKDFAIKNYNKLKELNTKIIGGGIEEENEESTGIVTMSISEYDKLMRKYKCKCSKKSSVK